MALTTNEMANFDELSVDKRVEGKYKFHRTLMKLGYIFIPLALIVLMFAIGWGAFALLVFIPLFYCWAFTKFVIPYTWRYVNISYTYTVKSGKFSMSKIMSGKGTKKVKEEFAPVSISDMTVIAPYNGEYKDAADASDIVNRYETCSFLNHPDNYYFIWNNEKGEKSVCIFQATNNTIKIMKFHNRDTVVTEVQKVSALNV